MFGTLPFGLEAWADGRTLAEPVLDQTSFRFYNSDGTNETNSTAYAAQDSSVTAPSGTTFLLRIRVQEAGTGGGSSTDDFSLYASTNGGAKYAVNDASTGASHTSNTAPWGNGIATTNQLGSGSGSFLSGKAVKNGAVEPTIADVLITQGNYTELVWGISASGVSNGDVITYFVYRNGVQIDPTPTVTPTWTIGTAGSNYVYKGARAWSAAYLGTRSDAALYKGTRTLHP